MRLQNRSVARVTLTLTTSLAVRKRSSRLSSGAKTRRRKRRQADPSALTSTSTSSKHASRVDAELSIGPGGIYVPAKRKHLCYPHTNSTKQCVCTAKCKVTQNGLRSVGFTNQAGEQCLARRTCQATSVEGSQQEECWIPRKKLMPLVWGLQIVSTSTEVV